MDILADVVNLEICETVGLDSCLNEVLQFRAMMNGRICAVLNTYCTVSTCLTLLYAGAIVCDALSVQTRPKQSLRRHWQAIPDVTLAHKSIERGLGFENARCGVAHPIFPMM